MRGDHDNMTEYDDILDLALVSIDDYRLNGLSLYLDETNYNYVIESESYDEYKQLCADNGYFPTKIRDYDYIRQSGFANYTEYVEDTMRRFKLILEGFMVRGLSNFDNCLKDLSDRNDEARVFNVQLDDMEKSILADYTVLMWLDKEINDTRQITSMLQNKNEAHRYSEANNLNAKVNHRIQLNEDVSTKKSLYMIRKGDWKKWADGEYGI